MKKSFKLLLILIAIPLGVGAISALISFDSMKLFATLDKPPLSPPAILFPIVWTILYATMGYASYLVAIADKPFKDKRNAFLLYSLQLIFNFFWSVIFFNLMWYGVAFLWLAVLFVLIIYNIRAFFSVSRLSGLLLLPYLLWVAFAGYLNLGIAFLN